MKPEQLMEEDAINICIHKIILEINKKTEGYEKTNNREIKLELIELIKDRELVYSNDKKTIEKYLKNRSK